MCPLLLIWRKGQDSNLRDVNLLVFKTSAINHSATLPRFIISYLSVDVEVGSVGGVDAEIHESNHFVVGEHVGGVEFGIGEFRKSFEGFLGDGVSSGADRKSD